MNRRWEQVAIARLVLENRTAMALSTGHSRSVFDSELVTDWNGLPMIPGSSLAGVLRGLCLEADQDAESWFGHQKGDGEASLVHVSHGLLQGAEGKVLESLDLDGRIGKDTVWSRCRMLAQTPTYRHGVRLNHRGVVDGDGKYDLAVLAPGHRFTCELRVHGEDEATCQRRMDQVLAALAHPRFALGARTRSGLGRIHVRDLRRTCIPRDHLGFIDPRLSVVPDWPGQPLAAVAAGLHIEIEASVDGGWLRVGGGAHSLASEDDAPDVLPYSEERLVWSASEARYERRPVIPGSALRGPLRHRTLFHLRCLHRLFRGSEARDDAADVATEAVDRLFGHAKDREDGQAGLLHFEDLMLEDGSYQVQDRARTSIDRFTGGVRHGLLFDEQQLFVHKPLRFRIVIDERPWEAIDEDTKTALARALRDLCEGLLPIGGGGTNGLGALKGSWRKEGVAHVAG